MVGRDFEFELPPRPRSARRWDEVEMAEIAMLPRHQLLFSSDEVGAFKIDLSLGIRPGPILEVETYQRVGGDRLIVGRHGLLPPDEEADVWEFFDPLAEARRDKAELAAQDEVLRRAWVQLEHTRIERFEAEAAG